MLLSFQLEGFKSYADATLTLGVKGGQQVPLSVLIGANASGKTNLIEGLRLLSTIAGGTRLDAIRSGSTAGLRGGLPDLGYRGTSTFSFACSTDFDEYERYRIVLELRDDRLHIRDERVWSDSRVVPLFQVVDPSEGYASDVEVAYDNFARGGKKPRVRCTDQISLLTQLSSSARFQATHKKAQRTVPQYCSLYRSLLGDIRLLDPRPTGMRGYSHRNDTILDERGTNLSAVLFDLSRDPATKETILRFIRDVPEQDIEDIDFIVTERGDVMVKLTETFGGHRTPYDASRLSDGTLRILAVAAALLSAPEGGLMIIEEIDNGVHASRVEALLQRLSSIAGKRGLKVLVTSHNPALLDALPDNAVPDVVFCYRDREEGFSRLIRLEDVPDYPRLLMQGPLGRLVTRRTLDRFVSDGRTQDDRQRLALDWLAAQG
ncbi:MAG: AAA family ATPase [Gammaproteobacteria bacterium]|nr:AAA family ATPase [Gammaproteobacteria bacterium]